MIESKTRERLGLNGTTVAANSSITTTSGTVTITNSGLLTVAANLTTIGGAFHQDGAGAVSIGAFNITTSDDAITFDGDVTFTGNSTISSGAGAGDITPACSRVSLPSTMTCEPPGGLAGGVWRSTSKARQCEQVWAIFSTNPSKSMFPAPTTVTLPGE